MKQTLFVLGQVFLFLLFLGVFFAGSFLGLFHLDPFGAPHWFVNQSTHGAQSYFIPSGLLLMSVIYLLVFVGEALARRLRTAGLWTSVAYILALVIGLASRFGFVHPS